MRRCPTCFSVYEDNTARCGPCDAPTEAYTERREPPSVPAAAGPESPPDADGEPGEVVLAEADADWAERAMEALGSAGISAQALLTDDEPPVVALVVQAADQERAGEALDEPPSVPRRPAPPNVEEHAGPEAEEGEPEEPEPEAPRHDRPPRPPDPDQAALCPECGEAYRAGFERCADCDVPLVPAEGDPGA